MPAEIRSGASTVGVVVCAHRHGVAQRHAGLRMIISPKMRSRITNHPYILQSILDLIISASVQTNFERHLNA